VVSILLGFALIFVAYCLWREATAQHAAPGMGRLILLAILVAIAGWLLIGELPQAMAVGDPQFYQSLLITTTYAMGTVPAQLLLGLFLAYLLFYEVRFGKALYRMIYFMPYVAPTVATDGDGLRHHLFLAALQSGQPPAGRAGCGAAFLAV